MTHKRSLVQVQYGPLETNEPRRQAGFIRFHGCGSFPRGASASPVAEQYGQIPGINLTAAVQIAIYGIAAPVAEYRCEIPAVDPAVGIQIAETAVRNLNRW